MEWIVKLLNCEASGRCVYIICVCCVCLQPPADVFRVTIFGEIGEAWSFLFVRHSTAGLQPAVI